ncbi:MAG: M1 family peptidase [Spirochaetaceae bacterium]|nr:MAG: M1 family peptidase [Spirochaetaceae bacterium]
MNTTIPTRYTIRIDPDLAELTFTGTVKIDFEAREPTKTVELDCMELDVSGVKLLVDDRDATLRFHTTKEQLVVELGRAFSGEFALEVSYAGVLGDSMAGLYRSRYVHEGREGYLAVTQFEERDARRAFPCIDHPAYKAVFAIEIVTAPGHTAIANTHEIEIEELGERVVHRFAPTPPLSTYLVFFGAGPFETLSDESWRVPTRVAVAPGKSKYAAPALEYSRKSLEFLENYTGIPYPLAKMDTIGVADFAYGAMENFGAILYRENYVLTYPESTTRRETERMVEITAHETAHMWFGDLVSPADWKYVWLNEAFATLFGNLVVDHWYPEWRTMEQLLVTGTAAALSRDSLSRTIPIEFADGREVEIDASSAPIIYQKGAGILLMVKGFYGDEVFRDATNAFLNAHMYACANTEGFLSAFTARLSPDPEAIAVAREMLTRWITLPGYPVISVRRNGPRLELRQSRFSSARAKKRAGSHSPDADAAEQPRWIVPVTGLVPADEPGSGGSIRLLLSDETATIDLDAEWCKLNAAARGYYRVFYEDPSEWDRLGEAAAAGRLSALDRYSLVSDLVAFVHAGTVRLEYFLTFLENFFADETEYVVLYGIASALSDLFELLGGDERIRATGITVLERLSDDLLADPTPDEPYRNVLLRDTVLWALALFGTEAVRTRADEIAAEIVAGDAVHPDLFPVMLRCASASDSSVVGWIRDSIESTDTPEGRKSHLLSALGSVRDAKAVDDILAFVIESVPVRNRLFFLRSASANPTFRPYLWPWFLRHFEALSQIHAYHLGATFATVIPYGGLGRDKEVTGFIAEYRKNEPRVSSGVLEMTLDRLDGNRRFIEREA